jgi:uncharacterized membrane protein
MFGCKKWWRSKVIWVNFISVLILVTQYLTDTHYIGAQMSVLIMGVINIILRLATYKQLES